MHFGGKPLELFDFSGDPKDNPKKHYVDEVIAKAKERKLQMAEERAKNHQDVMDLDSQNKQFLKLMRPHFADEDYIFEVRICAIMIVDLLS